jgi:spermidine synthase
MSDTPSTHPASSHASQRYLPLMLILFIGSGCAALIYEIVWYQMLQLVIGLTTISLGLLLGSFMGGMCVGSLAISRLVKRGCNPLRVYATLELGIGVIGLLELWLVPHVGAFYSDHAGDGHSYLSIIARGVVAAVCLLPPTLLMGATLPAIARWVETTPSGVSWLGFFYGGNIVGAVFGCLLAGFYLLRVHDMATATYVAAAINATVALLAYALSGDNVPLPTNEAPLQRAETVPGAWAIYASIALSGLTALGAEVIWTRLLSLLLGGTVYTFSIILAVFLFGLGIGSSLGSFIGRGRLSPRVALAICQMLLIAGIAWTSFTISHSLPHWPIDPTLIGTVHANADHLDGVWYVFQLDLAIAMWTILPAAILWGASFPLALAAVSAPGQDPGRLVGSVYAANTVGAIAGALFFSIAAVPLWGTQASQRILIGLAALSTFVSLAPLALAAKSSGKDAQGHSPVSSLGAAVLLVLTLVAAPLLGYTVSPGYWGAIAYGRQVATYQGTLMPDIIPESAVPQDGSSSIYCVYAGEGLNGTVAVTVSSAGIRSFHSAGKVQASNDPHDMRLQRMLGHLSALATVNPPKKVLVVACGAGVTAGTFLLQPSVEEITICDIEPLVPKYVTPMFTKENYGITDNVVNENPRIVHTPVGDKKVTVVYDDGRHFIRTTKEKFDVITSDPIDPWVKGCAALNTVEYYTMCKDHLNPGGVMSLWIPFYESNDASAKSVLGTFFKVYPNGILWSNDYTGDGYDAVLFAQVEPTKINVDEWQARLDSPPFAAVKQSLSEAGFHNVAELLGTYAGRAADLGQWMEGAEINEDSNLRLQYIAGMALNTYDGTGILHRILDHYKYPADMFVGSEAMKQTVREAIEGPRRITPVAYEANP